MNIWVVSLIIVKITVAQNITNNGGRSYFFKMGKNNNEFRVNNRIMYLNHNITDIEYPVPEEKKAKHQPAEKFLPNAKLDFTLFLDDEWNYNHNKNINKSQLPMFVKTFYEETTQSTTTTTRILFNTNKNNSSSILKFNLYNLNLNDQIVDADLYLYWPLKNNSPIFKESVVLRLYQFQNLSYEENSTDLVQNPDIHKLFNVIYVSKAHKGWQTFKVRKPIDNWLNGEENLGLILTISSYDTNTLLEVFKDTNRGNFSTFIVLKTQNNNSLSQDNEIVTGKEEDISDFSSQCQEQIWTINFHKMGWDKFIIFPEEFLGFDCIGKCSKPLEKDINHAKFLYMFQRRSACCVPTKYSSLPIMYFDAFGDIAIKNYDKMIVKGCGCR